MRSFMCLLLATVTACVARPPTTEVVGHVCTLCDDSGGGDGGSDGNNGGGGHLMVLTQNFLDSNFPGWGPPGDFSCSPDENGLRCDAYFTWNGATVNHECTEFPDGSHDCV